MSAVAHDWKPTDTGLQTTGLAYAALTVDVVEEENGGFVATLWEDIPATRWDPPDCQPVTEQVFRSAIAARMWTESQDFYRYADSLHWESVMDESMVEEQQS